MAGHYPFSALVGQSLLKKGLLVNAVDPSIGGVLLRGEKGTWIRGHDGHTENERCDKLARDEIKRCRKRMDHEKA